VREGELLNPERENRFHEDVSNHVGISAPRLREKEGLGGRRSNTLR